MNSKKTKEIVSFILLFTIVPLLLIPGLSFVINEKVAMVFDFFFAFAIGIILAYGIYELIFAIKTSKKTDFKEKNLSDEDKSRIAQPDSQNILLFAILAVLYLLPFLYIVSTFVLDFNTPINIKSIFLTMATVFIVANMIFVFFKELSSSEQLLITGISSLIFMFAISLVFITIYYSFAILFLVLITTSVSDMSAFFVGKKIGKRKIVPEISPNKTLEGFVGAFFISLLFAIVWYLIFIMPKYSNSYIGNKPALIKIIALILIVPVVAPIGDLFFSKVKREHNIKDFGKIIPGHGGMLDRVDSHIFTLSIAMIILLI